MIFHFIRYTQPAWQFNILPESGGRFASCYIAPGFNTDEKADEEFETESAKIAELGYRMWSKGYLLTSTQQEIEDTQRLPGPTLKDEYIFIRKYWGGVWAYYAYMMRICTLKNPFRETAALFKTRKVKRINPFLKTVDYKEYEHYSSGIIHSNPLVAVIIPTLNRYECLKNALHDLEKQSFPNFEVVVVDQSDNFNERFYKDFQLKLKVIYQKERLLWTARNKALRNTTADFILFFDDDSRVGPGWIEEHLKCLDYFNADISAGVSLSNAGQKISASYRHFRWADQFDSGNAMLRRSVMQRIGMFDEQFNGQRMGDAEFGLRAYINGLKSISNPNASRIHLKVSSGGLREMGHWDGFRTKKWFAPKPVPSVIYLYKKYFPGALADNALLLGIMLSNVGYNNKSRKSMMILSIILTIIKSPILFIQFKKAQRIADKMLAKNIGYLSKRDE